MKDSAAAGTHPVCFFRCCSRRQNPRRPARGQMDALLQRNAGHQPGQQNAKLHVIVVGFRAGRRSSCGFLGRSRLPSQLLLLSRQPKKSPQHCRPRRHQCRQKTTKTTATAFIGCFTTPSKAGDFRSREANVHRLAEISLAIIDQAVAQGSPFCPRIQRLLGQTALLAAPRCRAPSTPAARTGQQLLLGAYSALSRQNWRRQCADVLPPRDARSHHGRRRRPRGIVVRDMVLRQADGAHRRRCGARHRRLRQPLLSLDQRPKAATSQPLTGPTNTAPCLPTPASRRSIRPASLCLAITSPKLTLMSESLRNDGPRPGWPKKVGDHRSPGEISDAERDYFLERKYPSFGNLVPRDVASRKRQRSLRTLGLGIGGGMSVYLDFRDAIARLGAHTIALALRQFVSDV